MQDFINYWCCSALILVLLGTSPVHASTYLYESEEALIDAADLVIHGKVEDITSGRPLGQKLIYSYVTLSIVEVLKGRFGKSKIIIRELGGKSTADRQELVIVGAPSFHIGEPVILYLKSTGKSLQTLHLAL